MRGLLKILLVTENFGRSKIAINTGLATACPLEILPLRCWQFRLKELRIRTPSPMLGQVMFVCVPSALGQWN